MSGAPIQAGPFVGGLNTLSDPGAIQDHELVICQNFEVDPDGALKSRPPFVNTGSTFPSNAGLRLLGYFIVGGSNYVIASGGGSTYYLNGTSWTLITNTFAATACTQFQGLLWLVAPQPAALGTGGTWNGSTFTANTSMPSGSSIVAYRGRLFITTTGTTVQYSAVINDSNFWTIGSTFGNTFDVGGGDGQANVALILISNVLLIFRSQSIWQFSFSTDPAAGSQALLVPDIGLASPDAIRVFEGTVYFMYDGRAYVLNGAMAQQLNLSVPFTAVLRSGCYLPFVVSVVGRRIVFSYYDTMYVFNLRSRTWTTWTSPSNVGIGRILQISGATVSDTLVYVAHTNFLTTGNQPTLRFTDGYTTDSEPTFNAILQTKTYDYATPMQIKRLFYWGIDAIFKASLSATIIPERFSSRVTWGQLLSTTWGSEQNYTWGQPLVASPDITTTVTPSVNGAGPLRKAVKLPKSMRSRRFIYRVVIPVDGSSTTSPAKVFGIEMAIAVKQLVSKQIS